jgi:hypothetical protein
MHSDVGRLQIHKRDFMKQNQRSKYQDISDRG